MSRRLGVDQGHFPAVLALRARFFFKTFEQWGYLLSPLKEPRFLSGKANQCLHWIQACTAIATLHLVQRRIYYELQMAAVVHIILPPRLSEGNHVSVISLLAAYQDMECWDYLNRLRLFWQ